MAAGIDTPPLLSRSTIPEQGACVLIYAAITDARNAEEMLTLLASPEARG